MPDACGVAERVQLMTEGRNFRGGAIFASLKMTALRKVALAMEELAYEAGDAIVQLGGVERLRQLAGLYDDNPDPPGKLKQAAGAEDSEDDECRLREVAMDALRCIADAQRRTEQLELAARQERENAETERAEAGVASAS